MDPKWQALETQYQSEFTKLSGINPDKVIEKNTLNLSDYSASELLQMAYDKVEREIEQINAEMRQLRQKHRNEEERVQRRLIQKSALRQKILEQARN